MRKTIDASKDLKDLGKVLSKLRESLKQVTNDQDERGELYHRYNALSDSFADLFYEVEKVNYSKKIESYNQQ